MTFKELYLKASKNTLIVAEIIAFGVKMRSIHSAQYWDEIEHELENKKVICFYVENEQIIVRLSNE